MSKRLVGTRTTAYLRARLGRGLICCLIVLLAVRVWPRPALRDQFPQSTSYWSSDGELLRVTLASDDQYRLWTPLAAMSPVLIDAFSLKEDRWFRWHPGVNPVALIHAGMRTWRGGGHQGGSTLDYAARSSHVSPQHEDTDGQTSSVRARALAGGALFEARFA